MEQMLGRKLVFRSQTTALAIYIIRKNRKELLALRNSQTIGYVSLAALFVVTLAFGPGVARQQFSAVADSLTESVEG